MNYALGRQPNDPSKPRLKLSNFMRVSTTAPPTADWLTKVPSWPMYGNDTIGDCVTPDTLVLTESLDWVTAGSLRPGDRLLGFEEDSRLTVDGRRNGRWFEPAVVERADVVTRPCYELEFSDGTIVRSSAGHQWLTRSTVQGELGCQRWERTEDLRTETPRQTHVVKSFDTWQTDTSWHAGYLAAALDGEGHLEQHQRANRVAFNQTANAMLDQVELSMKELGFEYHHEVHSRNKLLRIDGTPRKEMHTLRIGQRSEFLRFMGSVRPRRLLEAYDVASLGRIPNDPVALARKTFIGEQPVVMLDTSSRTYFANGMASHNCTCAAAGHMIEQWTEYVGKETVIDTSAVLKAYEDVSGYNPDDPSSDQGAVMQDVLNYWRKTGIGGDKILAFAEVDVANLNECRLAIAEFGTLYLGINFPASAMDQFNNGQPWDYVRGSQIEGGHAINAGWYDEPSGMWKVVTWGRVQEMTQEFFSRYVEEAWVVATQDWINATGSAPTGVDVAALGEQFAGLTGEPSPFRPEPQPDPTPVPDPTPEPPDDVVEALVEALSRFTGTKECPEYLEKAAHDWLSAQ